MAASYDLTDKLMVRFEMFPNFHPPINDNEKRINWIRFSPDGTKLVAASNRHALELYNCDNAQQEGYLDLMKHGISAIEFMDTSDTVLIGSTGRRIKYDFTVRELNMTKKTYDTCYMGHRAPVKSLAVNQGKKYFVSGGHDKSALVFDFRVTSAQISCTTLTDAPLVALHPTTDICAVALDSNRIELYDLRSFAGPFSIFKLNVDNVIWTSLKFSPNGKQLLISSNSSKIRIINSYTGFIQDVFGSKFEITLNYNDEVIWNCVN